MSGGKGGWGTAAGAGGGGWGTAVAPPSTTICIVNLPDQLTPREFRFIFKFASGVERCIINLTKQGHQVGYARFTTLQDAQAAVEYLNGYPLDEDFATPVKAFMSTTQLNDTVSSPGQGRGMKRPMDDGMMMGGGGPPAKFAKGAGGKGGMDMGMGGGKGKGGKGKGGGSAGGKGVVTNTLSVYVGGVPHDWDESMISGLFEAAGTITKVNLSRGKNPIGNIAFVHYATPPEAQAAINSMNGYAIDESRYLTVRGNTSAVSNTE